MNRRVRSALLIVIGLVVVIAFARYLYLHAEEYRSLLRLSAGGMAMLFILAVGIPLFNGVQNTLLYRSLGLERFTQREGFMIAAASSLANQLPIPGGLVSKGFYLKRIHQLSYSLFTSSTLALFVCFLSLDGFIGLLILLYWALVMRVPAPLSLWIGFLAMAAAILVFLLPVERLRLPERIHARVHQALEGWVHIRKHPIMVLQVLAVQVVMILLAAARFWLAFHMLSQQVTFGQVLLMSNASILTQVVSIAPGGLGVREAVVGGVAAMLGFDMAASVLAVGLDRLMSTAVIFLAGGASMFLLGSQLSAQDLANADKDKA